MSSVPATPLVFISYSHDSSAHEEHVLRLANRLRSDGVDAMIDQYETFPVRGWTHWMRQQIEQARFVLVVCTETYRRRAEGKEMPGRGIGAVYEGSIIDQNLYEASGENLRFVPVVLTKDDSEFRPSFLRPYTYFTIEGGYDNLYRFLTGQPSVTREALGSLRSLSPKSKRVDYHSSFWSIPSRNRFFSARDAFLEDLRVGFTAAGTVAISQAVHGLGGIGKTQVAIEYAHRHRSDYTSGFWVTSDSTDAVISGFASLAGHIGIAPEDDLLKVAIAAKEWLEENIGWLLILDNVESLTDVKNWIPAGGHVLITTRLQATGTVAVGVELPNMTEEEGANFLLLRAKIMNPTEEDRLHAREITVEVGGLPLALDHAGAFIEETQSSPCEYLRLYRTRGPAMRARQSETADKNTVRTTFTLAFQRITQHAKDIICMCAFLAPDVIPEIILSGGDDPDLEFHEVIAGAAKFSLIRRNAARKHVIIHRIVQQVIRDEMDDRDQSKWAEHVAGALRKVFPDVEFEHWALLEELIPHARMLAHIVQQLADVGPQLAISSAAVFNGAGIYLYRRGQYSEAEELLQRALAIRTLHLGEEHNDTTTSLGDLALLYSDLKRYDEAESLLKRALSIDQAIWGSEHSEVATDLNNLGRLYHLWARWGDAEPLMRQALAMREKILGSYHPHTVQSMNNLAAVLRFLNRKEEAEPLQRRALAIRERIFGEHDPETAESLSNLALLCCDLQYWEEAEALFKRALAVREDILGLTHPSSLLTATYYSQMLIKQGRLAEARTIERRFTIK